MKLFRKLKDFKNYRNILAHSTLGDSIGLVPTMGNLHDGHLSLVEYSLNENETTVVTIFINPKQFGPNEDFNNYPRTLDQDLESLKNLLKDPEYSEKLLVVFAPESPQEIYRENFSTRIIETSLSNKLCGLSRPTHFEGVTTVVYKLFSTTMPHRAYFGQKDYQQYLIIQKMVNDLDLPIEIVSLPIVRDRDGLALSSRNKYLSQDDRAVSLELSKSLKAVEECLKNEGLPQAMKLLDNLRDNIKELAWEYLEVLDAENLEAPGEKSQNILVAGAVKVGSTRLIDNTLVQINAR